MIDNEHEAEGRRAVLADRDHPLGGNAGDPIDDPEIALGHAEAMHASRMVNGLARTREKRLGEAMPPGG